MDFGRPALERTTRMPAAKIAAVAVPKLSELPDRITRFRDRVSEDALRLLGMIDAHYLKAGQSLNLDSYELAAFLGLSQPKVLSLISVLKRTCLISETVAGSINGPGLKPDPVCLV